MACISMHHPMEKIRKCTLCNCDPEWPECFFQGGFLILVFSLNLFRMIHKHSMDQPFEERVLLLSFLCVPVPTDLKNVICSYVILSHEPIFHPYPFTNFPSLIPSRFSGVHVTSGYFHPRFLAQPSGHIPSHSHIRLKVDRLLNIEGVEIVISEMDRVAPEIYMEDWWIR